MSPGKAKTGLQIRMWAAAGLWGQHFLLKASELAAGGGVQNTCPQDAQWVFR